ncbi:class II glutamine amidotransferase [Nocardia africana]|uniref:class II glutamine amidotransferase n=1 Tax=Nocardia africana TaxID=134964 RepID=UPI0007A45567|nr:class II glutamine amidotransferase [Nocardia africana]MCC3311438.1 class II glutamine amidotransferase [Nocardia africana]
MCLLTYYPAGAAIDTSALRFGADANPDGHGFAIVADGHIVTGHGMNAHTVIATFARTRAEHPDGPALFHSRYATRGAIDLANCHPFQLGGDARTVLAHNGTLPKRVHPRAYDRRSDTRIAAEDYLPTQPFGPIDTAAGARGLAGWLGTSKLVILTVDPAYAHSAYMFGERAGLWVGGIWYSNRSYLPPELRWPARRPTVCGYCLDRDLERTSRHCRTCGWCFGCHHVLSHCTCLPTPTPPAPTAGPASS